MKKLSFFLLLIPLIGFSQLKNDNAPFHWEKDHRVKYPIAHISIGFFNHATGYSLISYTRNMLRGKNYSRKNIIYFVAFGTNIIQHSLALGVKKPVLESGLNKVLYSSIGLKGVYSIGPWDDFIAPSIAIGLDIPISNHPQYQSKYSARLGESIKWVSPGVRQKEFINIGISSTIRFNESRIKAIIIPNLNVSYRW